MPQHDRGDLKAVKQKCCLLSPNTALIPRILFTSLSTQFLVRAEY